jgi:phosphate uptake regulator
VCSSDLIDSIEDDEEKLKLFNEQLKRIADLTVQMITDSTEYIITPDGIKVSEPEYIKEFYERSESKIVNLIRDRLNEIARDGEIPRPMVACGGCEREYQITLTFDYASFFAKGF